MASAEMKPHAIIFPLPYQGHVTPFINLANKLASKGFTITFVNAEYINQMLTKTNNHIETDIFSEARKSGLDIRYTKINDGFSLSFERFLNFDEFWESLLQDFPTRVNELIGNIVRSDQSFIYFLIADTFFHWSATIAEKYNLLKFSFFTQPALVYSIVYHLDILREHGHYPCKDNRVEEINYLPGVKSVSTGDFMHYLKESAMSTTCHKAASMGYQEGKKAEFMLHYTVEALEFETQQALNKKQPSYAIGPIYPFTNLPKITVTKSLCLVQTNKQAIEEIAHGLILSEVNFIWVVRENIVTSDSSNVLPDGFEDEIKDRGMIVPWCDQITVLSNPGVGGFVTHYGFNSALESIWCGIPIIFYPLAYDQTVVRKLVVEDWKIGINLYDGSSVCREEVAEKIKFLMSETDSKGLRKEAKKLKNVLQKAADREGSSKKNFEQFVKDLKDKMLGSK